MPLTVRLLNKSERNIKALNFFGEVEITETPGDDEDFL